MSAGELVRVFAPGVGFLDEFGIAVFLRRLIPSRDLPPSHSFWDGRHMQPDVIADHWHNEILYNSTLHIIVEKQFILVPVEADQTIMRHV